MVTKVTEELSCHDGVFRVQGKPHARIIKRGRFSFELYRKQVRFGDVPIDQFWMSSASVYGGRGRAARNREVIIEYYRALCRQYGTADDEGAEASYIFAKLLPLTRSNGSRRVFDDSVLSRPRRDQQEEIKLLDSQLAENFRATMSIQDFHRFTNGMLGQPAPTAKAQEIYEDYEAQILSAGRRAIASRRAAGWEALGKVWMDLKRPIGRRKGNHDAKQALDILSYEARAALHRCYSTVWCLLIPQLAKKYSFSEESVQFHNLWHCELVLPSDDERMDYHAFHGHVFALHPSTSLFIQTETGGKLLADFLDPTNPPRDYARLLHGLSVAVSHYADRRSSPRPRRGDVEVRHVALDTGGEQDRFRKRLDR